MTSFAAKVAVSFHRKEIFSIETDAIVKDISLSLSAQRQTGEILMSLSITK